MPTHAPSQRTDPGGLHRDHALALDEKRTARDGTPRGSALQAQVGNILAGQVCEPENVAKPASYLAGPDSDHMTGQTVLIDGGINFS